MAQRKRRFPLLARLPDNLVRAVVSKLGPRDAARLAMAGSVGRDAARNRLANLKAKRNALKAASDKVLASKARSLAGAMVRTAMAATAGLNEATQTRIGELRFSLAPRPSNEAGVTVSGPHMPPTLAAVLSMHEIERANNGPSLILMTAGYEPGLPGAVRRVVEAAARQALTLLESVVHEHSAMTCEKRVVSGVEAYYAYLAQRGVDV